MLLRVGLEGARPRTIAHDHSRTTARTRTTTHAWPRTNDRARPRKIDHARPTTQVSIRRLPYLFGEAVHVVPPCERLNTNFHSIIRLANWGDIGSFCMLILLIIGASYRWAMICCTMLRMLFSLLYILDTVTNDLKIIMTCNYYYLGLIVLCCISIYNFNALAYNINHNSVCEYRHIHINSFDYTADIPGETCMAIRGLTNDPWRWA